MAQTTLSARIREDKGKGVARKLRRAKQVPAVFYGPNATPLKLVVDDGDLKAILRETRGENVLLQLQIESKSGTDSKTVMLKELQTDPIKPVYLHADFYEISMDRELTLEIPIHLINTPVGVTRGGILQQVRRELNVSCLPGKVVEFIEVDVSGLDIGDAVHVSDIKLPEGIKSNEEPHLTVAVVSAPTVTAEKVEEEEVVEEEEAPETEAAESDTE
ncbi:MAG: 50S ribosomal protein L25 [Deltaproteobacteria bacterium]|nr:50S ribosomal protein L25 [Deltaproteobacteria bacterium]MBW2043993.1 50S ribosomal protein L25 [Deltaproteobacteria bacterium]MBW2298806.1 50S ribosomal protein L25 [Deltaproteobacteria bacterium]